MFCAGALRAALEEPVQALLLLLATLGRAAAVAAVWGERARP
jgi:hypothetical protein